MKFSHAILKVGTAAMRLLYAPMKLRRARFRVTIVSRQSNRPTEDIALLAHYFEDFHPDLEVRILCRSMEDSSTGAYMVHLLRQMMSIAVSAVVVADGYSIPVSVLDHRDGTLVIQMWHALAAVKKFGYQTLDRPGGRSGDVARQMRMHRNYDQILCPGREIGRAFCAAFDAPEEKLLFMGLPRIDLICGPDTFGEDLRKTFGIPDEKEILLYVPTFRRDAEIPVRDIIRAADPRRFTLVIRPHPLSRLAEETSDQTSENAHVIVDRSRSSYHWLRACDRVITDYSALGLEAALTGKPLYFYLYDIEEYLETVGLNIDPRNEMAEACALDGRELGQLLGREYDRDALRRFREKYITIDTENCTQKLGEHIYGTAEKIYQEISDASSGAPGEGA